MRDKLIELIRTARYEVERICNDRLDCSGCPAAIHEGKCKDGYIADHLIANGVTVQEWIPVAERLPSQYSSVIVWTRDREIGEAQHDGKLFYWCEDDNFADVTHWMPLPEPPKGE